MAGGTPLESYAEYYWHRPFQIGGHRISGGQGGSQKTSREQDKTKRSGKGKVQFRGKVWQNMWRTESKKMVLGVTRTTKRPMADLADGKINWLINDLFHALFGKIGQRRTTFLVTESRVTHHGISRTPFFPSRISLSSCGATTNSAWQVPEQSTAIR